jgi:hypothetical protein
MPAKADNPPPESPDTAARRARARRTALLFAGIAVAIYALFILSGVVGK